MSNQVQTRPPKVGLPVSAVALFAAAGLAGAGAVVCLGLWLQTLGNRLGWWTVPADDEPGTALAFGCFLVALTVAAAWIGARRCRRVFGYSPLGTALVAVGVIAAVAMVTLTAGL